MTYDEIYRQLKLERYNGTLIDVQKRFGIKKNIAEKLIFALSMNTDSASDTVVGVLSDIHFGEVVHGSAVFGLNKYDPDVAEQRIKQFFSELRKTALERNAKRIVLLMLGDLISGMIHEELTNTNANNCVDQVESLCDILSHHINCLFAHFDGEVFSAYGNHGRVTQKLQHKGGYNNFDTLLGNSLKHRVVVPFTVLKDELTIINLTEHAKAVVGHGTYIRPSHVAPQTKLFKALDQYTKIDQNIKYLILGHLHNYMHFSRGYGKHVVVNGSVIGVTEFAVDLQFFGDPSQTILVLDQSGDLVYSKEVKLGY